MMVDTVKKLNIAYTTDSLLVATTKDGTTANVKIAKLDNKLACPTPNTTKTSVTVANIVMSFINVLLLFIGGSVTIVHLMFKELCTLFGKLLMLHCLFPFSVVITYFVRLIVELSPTVRQLTACHFLILGIVVSAVGYEVTVTSMLHSLTYILYRSNQLL